MARATKGAKMDGNTTTTGSAEAQVSPASVRRVKTVSVTYERKFSTAQYESATVGLTWWVDLADGEEPEQATRELWAQVKASVKEQALPILKGRQAQVKELFGGVEVTTENGKES
jgi:hypothetical protein